MSETPEFLIERPFLIHPVPGPNGSDVLSDVLRVFHVTGAALLRGEFTTPWAWETPTAPVIASLLHPGSSRLVMFHIVASGACWVEMEGTGRCLLKAGDIVGFPHGHAHRMGSGSAAVIPLASLLPTPPWPELPVLRYGGEGEGTHIMCVYLRCDERLFEPFLGRLPPMLVVRKGDEPSAQWIEANLRYLTAEIMRGGAGSSCLLARLTELLFIEILRQEMARLRGAEGGWLSGLNDRFVSRALGAMHGDPGRDWTVEALARESGLSRSALVQRFRTLLNTSPMKYLTTWRFHLATQALERGEEKIADIAERVGYGSEEAFIRAFKRGIGQSPAAWRRGRRDAVRRLSDRSTAPAA